MLLRCCSYVHSRSDSSICRFWQYMDGVFDCASVCTILYLLVWWCRVCVCVCVCVYF